MVLFEAVIAGLLLNIFGAGTLSGSISASGPMDFIEIYANTWNSFFTKLSTLSGNYGFLSFKLPREKDKSKPIPINNKFKIPTLEDTKAYLKFAAASFCNGVKLTNWICDSCVALGPDVKFIQVFNNETMGTRAYFALNEKREELVLSFRGTSNLKNMRDDAKIQLVPVDGGHRDLKVHQGAWEMLLSLYPQISCSLRSLIAKYPGYKIIIVGHSLGGMLASLALFKLKTDPDFQQLDYSLYSYGAPRSGNLAFAQWMNSQPITGIRVVGGIDIVPHVVGLRANGYVHHLRELWVHRTYQIFWKAKNQLCSAKVLEDPHCSVSIQDKLYLNFFQHLHYWKVFIPPLDCFQEWLQNWLN